MFDWNVWQESFSQPATLSNTNETIEVGRWKRKKRTQIRLAEFIKRPLIFIFHANYSAKKKKIFHLDGILLSFYPV